MRRRVILGLGAGAALAASFRLRAAPIPGPAHFLSAVKWHLDHHRFGGLSGLELSQDGSTFTAISDRGFVMQGKLARAALPRDRISRITVQRYQPLKDETGKRLSKRQYDAEGLAIGTKGNLFISFEGAHRLLHYRHVGARAEPLPRHADFAGFQANASVEALAIDHTGALYTLPERSGKTTTPFPVYRFANGRWDQPFSIPRRAPYLPVGADIGPDGRFYLLERYFAGPFGFSSRVRRFDMTPDGLHGERTLLTSGTGRHDNLEGLSVWRDAARRIRLTMVSDDNFNFLQRTEFVEYAVPE